MDNLDLQQGLTQAVTDLNLQGILTKFGIPENEPVTVYIKRDEQDLASCEIQPTSIEDYPENDKMCFRDFRSAILNDFLNQALVSLNICQHFPVTGEIESSKIKLLFQSGKSEQFKIEIQTVCCQMCPDGKHCCAFC
jgi:hypothetical protein